MDTINHPSHYNWFGIECLDVTDNFNFNKGNALKYIWRSGYKQDEIEDLQKAIFYLNREIERIKKTNER